MRQKCVRKLSAGQVRLVISGQPTTKKNNPLIVHNSNRPLLLPSRTFRRYARAAVRELWAQAKAMQLVTIDYPVTATCHYWLRNRRNWPDLCGLLQATADLLEEAGVIANDALIGSFGDSRIVGLDPKNPRVEITLEPLARNLTFQLLASLKLP